MFRFLSHTIKLMIIITFVCVSVPAFALMQNQNIDAVRNEYETAYGQRSKLAGELSGLESEYLNIVRRVDSAKKNINSIAGRLELEGLLRRSKEISAKLRNIQIKLSTLNSRIESKRTFVVRHIKNEMKKLERSLAVVPREERRNVVNKLNQLRKEKVQYSAPLPSVQSSYQESLALRDADSLSDNPDDLLAVADELQDSEDQLSKRLAAIDNQISELKRTQKLMRRSERFSSEDQFFEESDRARVIAKYDVVTTSKTSKPVDNVESSAPTAGSQDSDDSQNNSFNGAPDPNGISDQNSAEVGVSGARDDGTNTDNGAEPIVVAPPEVTEIETTERVLINGSGDPSRSVSSRKLGKNQNMKSRINSLESEKKKLKRRVNRLRQRAKKLRKRANSL